MAVPLFFSNNPINFYCEHKSSNTAHSKGRNLDQKRGKDFTKCQHTNFKCLETWQRPQSNFPRSQWKSSFPTDFIGIQTDSVEQNWCNQDGKLRLHQNSCNLQLFWKAWLKFVPFHWHTHWTSARQDTQTYQLSKYFLKPLECFVEDPGTGKIQSWSFLRERKKKYW